MGKSAKLLKALVAGIKAFKSPSKEKPEKDKPARKIDKDHHKKGNKEKCLWGLGRSSSQNHESLAAAAEAAFLDAPETKSTQVENTHVKDVPHTCGSLTSTRDYGSKGLVKEEDASLPGCKPMELVEQDQLAAIKIQAAYRRHLASRRVFRALRAVVRLQALARGRMVRKQAFTSLRCMQAIVKIQAIARGRRVRSSELGQLIQRHLQQTRHQRKKPVEGWVGSMGTLQQLQVKAQSKQDAVMKRQRALVYAFSEQLNRCTPRQNLSSAIDFQPDRSDWAWVWLERWMAARPSGNLPGVLKEQYTKEDMVKTIADVEVNAESYDKYILPLTLKEPVGNSNFENTYTDFVCDSVSQSQRSPLAIEKEAMSSVEKMQEGHMHIPMYVEMSKTEGNSEIETAVINNDQLINKAVQRSLPSPPPPPPPPPVYVKRAGPVVAHLTIADKDLQPVALANTHSEAPVVFEVSQLKASTRAAELPVETCTSTLATHLKSSCDVEPPSPDLPSAPVTDSMLLTMSANLPIEAFATQSKPQSYPESPLHYNQSRPKTSSLISETGEVLRTECGKANVSMPMLWVPDSAPISDLQPPSTLTVVSEVLVSPPQKHAVVCSPLSSPDVTYVDRIMSNGAYTPEEDEIVFNGDRTASVMESIHGFNEGNVIMNLVESRPMDLKNDPVEDDMDVEAPEFIDYKHDKVIEADSLSNGGCDTSVVSAGEKSADVTPSKHASPASRQAQHTHVVSPSVPNYMTTTKSSQAKIRAPTQKSVDSPKQKADSPKPRFDSSKQKIGSPKLKLDSLKQEVDSPKGKLESPKQKLDSPKQKPDFAAKRRHSLSALEGKGSPGVLKSSQHVGASSKGLIASGKDTCTENSPCPNGDSQRHGKPVAV